MKNCAADAETEQKVAPQAPGILKMTPKIATFYDPQNIFSKLLKLILINCFDSESQNNLWEQFSTPLEMFGDKENVSLDTLYF